MMVDLDGFKRVNDSYGHTAGDLVLQCVARILSLSLKRGDDIVQNINLSDALETDPEDKSSKLTSRNGGDEFALAFLSSSPADAIEMGIKVCSAMRHAKYIISHENSFYFDLDGMHCYEVIPGETKIEGEKVAATFVDISREELPLKPKDVISVTGSIGLTTDSSGKIGFASLLHIADTGAYRSKELGKDRIHYVVPTDKVKLEHNPDLYLCPVPDQAAFKKNGNILKSHGKAEYRFPTNGNDPILVRTKHQQAFTPYNLH